MATAKEKKKRKAEAAGSSKKKKSKDTTTEAEAEAEAAALPMDVVRIILLKSTPTSLRNLKAVCKDWRQLIRSPEFIKERTSTAWMVGVGFKKQKLRGWTWVWLYDPIANQREKVKFPLIETWPKAWQWQWKNLSVLPSTRPGELIVQASFARRVEYCRWNPITGFIELLAADGNALNFNRMRRMEVPMEFEKEDGWMETVILGNNNVLVVAVYTGCMKILKKDEVKSHWEVVGVMPDEIWQAIGQGREVTKWIAAAQEYVLMWTEHRGGEHAEVVVMFNLESGGWRMVDNKWHASAQDLCMWGSMAGPFFPTFC